MPPQSRSQTRSEWRLSPTPQFWLGAVTHHALHVPTGSTHKLRIDKQRITVPPSDMSAEPKPTDVCMGRGGRIYNRKMNKEYREFIQKRYEERRQQPGFRTDNLMETARELHREFFKKHPKSAFVKQVWVPTDYQEGLMKTWDVLRAMERSEKSTPTALFPPTDVVVAGHQGQGSTMPGGEGCGQDQMVDSSAGDVLLLMSPDNQTPLHPEVLIPPADVVVPGQQEQRSILLDNEGFNRDRMVEDEVMDSPGGDSKQGAIATTPSLQGRLDSLVAAAEERLGHDLAEPIKMIRGYDTVMVNVDEVLKEMSASTSLDLRNASEDCVVRISQELRHNSTLKELELRDSNIGNVGAAALAEALTHNSSLTEIDLNWNLIGDDGAAAMSEALKRNFALTVLDLSHSKIGPAGATFLANSLKINLTLKTLKLNRCDVGDTGLIALGETLKKNSALRELELSYSHIGDPGAVALAEGLKCNSTLHKVDLSYNNVGDVGARCVAEAIGDSSLTTLRLGCNRFGACALTAIVKALEQDSGLMVLALFGNGIADDVAILIAKALERNSTLSCLSLNLNRIRDMGATAFAEALKLNSCLYELNLLGNEIRDAGASALAEALKHNSKLKHLDLSYNCIADCGKDAIEKSAKHKHVSVVLGCQLNYRDDIDGSYFDSDESDDGETRESRTLMSVTRTSRLAAASAHTYVYE
jgi:Ran GTPase-activating protein (RanGAP) involved in mRNA processing and transport